MAIKISRTYECEVDVNDIQIGDKMSVKMGNFGVFTATAKEITDQGIHFIFDSYPNFWLSKSQETQEINDKGEEE